MFEIFKSIYALINFFTYRYLLEKDYPGIRIGPGPTTDKFTVIMGSDKDSIYLVMLL